MATKCVKCGVDSEADDAFRKQQSSLSPGHVVHYCPDCWSRREISKLKETLAFYLVGIGMACIWAIGDPANAVGWTMLNFLLLPLFLFATILPHELGHAIAARLVGAHVLAIIIGHGKIVFELKFPGQTITFKLIPMGGFTISAHKNKSLFRLKKFIVALAGPLANILLALILFPYLSSGGFITWDFEHEFIPLRLFIFANIVTAVVNLWPSTAQTELGKVASDGLALWKARSIKPKSMDHCHAMYFVGKATVSRNKKDYKNAQAWLQKGLDQYPENAPLQLHASINLLQLQQFATAREYSFKLLSRKDLTPSARYVILNNVAYMNVLIGDTGLLDEADRYSKEAIANLPWKAPIKGTRGSVLVQLGQIEEGMLLLQAAAKGAETIQSKAHNNCWMAMAEAKRGNLIEGKKYLATARRLDPDCYLIERTACAIGS
jgi:tetratricopeptide (TPR) repeat protein